MSKTALVVVSLVVLGACAAPSSPRVVYEKDGITDTERKHETAQCTTAAEVPGRADLMIGAYRLDRAAFDRCMRDKGYTPRREGTEMVPGDSPRSERAGAAVALLAAPPAV